MGRYTINKNISRMMAVLLVVVLLLVSAPSVYAEGESGSCGDSLSWSLSAGTLTITGSGNMTDFTESNMAPWYDIREEILRLELPDGLTSIGMLAFYGCDNLTTVIIPDSVTRIGGYAFAGCTDMEMLSLGSGVKNVGECAFSDCVSLAALRLPEGLQTIGTKAFYRCESITAVAIPASVTGIGMSAFAYCKDLVYADVQARISTIPEWMFYACEKLVSVTLPDSTEQISEFVFRGCDQLNTVYYDGSTKSSSEIQQIISTDVPGFEGTGFVSNAEASSTVISGTATENTDGTVTQENTTLNQGDHSTLSSTVINTHPADTTGGSYQAQITVTVENDQGWDEAKEAVEDALKGFNESVTTGGGTAEKVEITIYVNGTDTIDQAFVDSMAGRDVTVTIVTQNGSRWRLDGNDLDEQNEAETYDLSYQLSGGSAELCQELETDISYVLRFLSPAQINAEVLIRLHETLALQNATLLQRVDGELVRHQTVVVDSQGYAHFYLGSVSEETDYYIAVNLADVQDEAIIPDELLPEYGYPEPIRTMDYVITGTKSSWGMSIGQVTWILVGVMVGSVVIVGVVMSILNKRKLNADKPKKRRKHRKRVKSAKK